MVKIANDDTLASLVRQAGLRPVERQALPSRHPNGTQVRAAMMAAAVARMLEQPLNINPTDFLEQRKQQPGE